MPDQEPINKAEIVPAAPLTESPPSVYTASSKEPAKGASINEMLNVPAAGMVEILDQLIEVAATKLGDPKAVKRLSITELLDQITNLFKALKQSNITINNNTIKHLEQIRHYGQLFQEAGENDRRRARVELRTKLKRRPQ